jgi:hypothetical protein
VRPFTLDAGLGTPCRTEIARSNPVSAAVTRQKMTRTCRYLDNPLYRERPEKALMARRLHPFIEQMLSYYAKGKPVDRVEHGGPEVFRCQGEAELRACLVSLLHRAEIQGSSFRRQVKSYATRRS